MRNSARQSPARSAGAFLRALGRSATVDEHTPPIEEPSSITASGQPATISQAGVIYRHSYQLAIDYRRARGHTWNMPLTAQRPQNTSRLLEKPNMMFTLAVASRPVASSTRGDVRAPSTPEMNLEAPAPRVTGAQIHQVLMKCLLFSVIRHFRCRNGCACIQLLAIISTHTGAVSERECRRPVSWKPASCKGPTGSAGRLKRCKKSTYRAHRRRSGRWRSWWPAE